MNHVKAAQLEASRREFSRRRNLPGVEVRHMNSKRTTDVVLTLLGREIGTRTVVFSRGKVASENYFLPTIEV